MKVVGPWGHHCSHLKHMSKLRYKTLHPAAPAVESSKGGAELHLRTIHFCPRYVVLWVLGDGTPEVTTAGSLQAAKGKFRNGGEDGQACRSSGDTKSAFKFWHRPAGWIRKPEQHRASTSTRHGWSWISADAQVRRTAQRILTCHCPKTCPDTVPFGHPRATRIAHSSEGKRSKAHIYQPVFLNLAFKAQISQLTPANRYPDFPGPPTCSMEVYEPHPKSAEWNSPRSMCQFVKPC